MMKCEARGLEISASARTQTVSEVRGLDPKYEVVKCGALADPKMNSAEGARTCMGWGRAVKMNMRGARGPQNE
jgi:hypothetical protein